MSLAGVFWLLGICVVGSPLVLIAVLGVSALLDRPLSERAIAGWTSSTVLAGLGAAVTILVLMLASGTRNVPVELGHWVEIEREHFHFHLKFVFDRLSVPFVILSFVLVGTIGAFANRYLHREPGYRRFFLLFSLFLFGIVDSAAAGTIETLFVGWELVGLSSALLVAFFQERPGPILNGERVWSTYRMADAAFLIAAVVMHHQTGAGEFSELISAGPWPHGEAALTSSQALLVGSLLLVAAAGKSALIPFSGWLPRAMEGPTPSSAVFYGALSVHLGTYLLLRVAPILDRSAWLSGAVVLLGLSTALFAAATARVQTDVKSALAYASLTQVGIITAEIGLGFRYLALVHIIGHACLRTLQLVRSPTLLHDYHALENAIGAKLPGSGARWRRVLPIGWEQRIYRLSMERGYLDASLDHWLVGPLARFFRGCENLERRWMELLSKPLFRKEEFLDKIEETT